RLLVAARAMQGLAAAVMMVLTMAVIGESVPKGKIARAMGLLGAASAVGTALGPSVGGVLIAWLGWRAIFFINVPAGLLTLLLVRHYLPADERRTDATRTRFDAAGTLLLAL